MGAEVVVRSGLPILRFLTPIPAMYRGFPLIPVDDEDPYAFRIDILGSGLEPMRVVFSQDLAGATTRLHFDRMPLTLVKGSAISNPRRWMVGSMGLVSIAATTAVTRTLGS